MSKPKPATPAPTSPLKPAKAAGKPLGDAIQLALRPLQNVADKLKLREYKEVEVYPLASLLTVLDVSIVSFLRVSTGELLVERYPLTTNAIQGAILVFAGDLVSQMFPKSRKGIKKTKLDFVRLMKASVVGIVNVGLWPYYWYLMVDTFLPNQAPVDLRMPIWAFEWGMLGLKIVLDSVFNGVFSIVSSFSLWSLMDGDSVDLWKRKFTESFLETWLMDWKSWPFYNVLCFSVIPLRLRPMTSGIASMLWNAYVSHQSQSVGNKQA